MTIFQTLLSNGLVKARLLKAINGASMAAGAWALTSTYVYLTTHLVTISQTDALSIAGVVSATVAGLVLTVGSTILDQADASKVSAKIAIAASTGSVQTVNDPQAIQVAKAVQSSPTGSPEALKAALDTLQAGKE